MTLNRQQAKTIIEQMKSEVVRPECWTCDCFQGLLTQLELDCAEDIADLTTPLKAPKEKCTDAWAATLVREGQCLLNISGLKPMSDKNNTNIKEIPMEAEKKKKGFMAAIWESMTKTGGCCGGGGNCCGPSNDDDTKTNEKKSSDNEEKRN
jgi:hypothetical protein